MTDTNNADTPELVVPEVIEAPPRDPGAFTEGAFAPAVDAPVLSLKEQLRQNQVRQEIQGVRRAGTGRTRTPREPKKDDEKGEKSAKENLDELRKARDAKKRRADEIAGEITGEFNDVILRFIISQGAPPALLYNDGHVPVSVGKASQKYTPLGQKIAVDDFTAGMVGSFIAEFESSDLGAQLVGKATGGPVGLVIKGLVAGACVVGYLNGVREVVKQIQPIAESYRQYQKNQQQNNRQGVADHGLN